MITFKRDDKRVYNTMRKVRFHPSENRFHNSLEKELRELVSSDVLYSHTYWNENDKLNEEIYTVKDSVRNSVIRNKYKTVYKI